LFALVFSQIQKQRNFLENIGVCKLDFSVLSKIGWIEEEFGKELCDKSKVFASRNVKNSDFKTY